MFYPTVYERATFYDERANANVYDERANANVYDERANAYAWAIPSF
jgi:hypothetical protein